MNKYSDCGNFIIDSSGKQWPVDVAHPLPLPEGIEAGYFEGPSSDLASVVFTAPSRPWRVYLTRNKDTHWLARRPLPEIPKPKTQEELDEEALRNIVTSYGFFPNKDAYNAAKEVLAYARKGQQ